jgi:hypothetical protein
LGGTVAGAPLRAMASLAAIWIVLRLILLNSPAGVTSKSADRVTDYITGHDAPAKRPSPAVVPSNLTENGRRDGGSGHRHLPAADAARGTDGPRPGGHPVVARPSGLARLLLQPSEDIRGFFLPIASHHSGDRTSRIAKNGLRFPSPPERIHDNKMTAYFWIYARQDSEIVHVAPGNGGGAISNGQYGGSQAGAILSYRLFDPSVTEISLYGRFSAALTGWSQKEIALGARVKPLAALPVALHVEQRFDAGSGGDAGSAFFVTGGTGPDPIVDKFAIETYAQAGYVAGRNKTYFFDGSATLQRPIAEFGDMQLSVGPGVWTGGQRNITRMDVGPRASLKLPVETVSVRVAVDGRIRIAGNARPGNGPAITLSTGF